MSPPKLDSGSAGSASSSHRAIVDFRGTHSQRVPPPLDGDTAGPHALIRGEPLRSSPPNAGQWFCGVREGPCKTIVQRRGAQPKQTRSKKQKIKTAQNFHHTEGNQPDMTVLHNKPLNVVLKSIESPYRIFILGGLTANWRLPPPHRPYQKDLLRTHGRTSKSNLE